MYIKLYGLHLWEKILLLCMQNLGSATIGATIGLQYVWPWMGEQLAMYPLSKLASSYRWSMNSWLSHHTMWTVHFYACHIWKCIKSEQGISCALYNEVPISISENISNTISSSYHAHSSSEILPLIISFTRHSPSANRVNCTVHCLLSRLDAPPWTQLSCLLYQCRCSHQ